MTLKEFYEATKDMPKNVEILAHTWEGFEPLRVEGYYKDACMEHKGNVIILEVC
jgi:hypothetical protein